MPPSLDPEHVLIRLDQVKVARLCSGPAHGFHGINPELSRVKHRDSVDLRSRADTPRFRIDKAPCTSALRILYVHL